jgi:hypothetical protein
MKPFLKLAVLALLIFLSVNYIKDHNIDLKEEISNGLAWVQENMELEEPKDQSSEETGSSRNAENHLSQNNNEGSPYRPSPSYERSNPSSNQITNQTSYTNEPQSSSNSEEQFIQPIETTYSSEENLAWIKEVSSENAHTAWNLLMQYEQLPQRARIADIDGGELSSNKPCGTFHYLQGDSRLELLQSMGTNVHELTHAFYSHNAYRCMNEKKIKSYFDDVEGYIYLDPKTGWLLSFPESALFPSAKLQAVIPESLRTFRFDTYITGNTSTQGEGVFGLLDEFHAYYQGSLYDYNTLSAYKEAVGSDGHGLGRWIQYSKSSMSACYEFDFFIHEYLLYMKQQFPENYNKLRMYSPFREAYTELRKRFYELNEAFLSRIEQEAKSLSEQSEDIKIRNNSLEVPTSDGRSYNLYSFECEDCLTLLPVLRSNRYDAIKQDWELGN